MGLSEGRAQASLWRTISASAPPQPLSVPSSLPVHCCTGEREQNEACRLNICWITSSDQTIPWAAPAACPRPCKALLGATACTGLGCSQPGCPPRLLHHPQLSRRRVSPIYSDVCTHTQQKERAMLSSFSSSPFGLEEILLHFSAWCVLASAAFPFGTQSNCI